MTIQRRSRLSSVFTDQARAPYRFILERVKTYRPDADLELVMKACEFAIATHRGETRVSGKPFVIHPLRVAYLLAQMKLDETTVAAGALHDTIEDTSTTYSQLQELFGDEVANLVMGVTNVWSVENLSKEEKRAHGFRQMVEAMLSDIRILLVKFCDRLHNMRTLGAMPEKTRKLIASETMALYVPLAARFGIFWLWREYEDLCFRYLHPESYTEVKSESIRYFEKTLPYQAGQGRTLKKFLQERNLSVLLKMRRETIYRLRLRMLTEKKSISELEGVIYLRLLLNNTAECYIALEALDSLWETVPGSLKDYILKPKANNYQSIHLTLMDPNGFPVKVQLRTREMDRIDEQGVTAIWSSGQSRDVSSYFVDVKGLISQLTEALKDDADPLHFTKAITRTLYADEVRVFTPKKDLVELPKGSTVLDFAYAVHSELGSCCSSALVDGSQVSIDYVLKAGQQVRILTDPNVRPQENWLKYAVTMKARKQIKQRLRTMITNKS